MANEYDFCEKNGAIYKCCIWRRNGDHPEDNIKVLTVDGRSFYSEGKIVRRFRRPDVEAFKTCSLCGFIMHDHGWLDVCDPEGGPTVCPGDWIVSKHEGGFESYPPKVFHTLFKKVSNGIDFAGTLLSFDDPQLPFKIHVPPMMNPEERRKMFDVLNALLLATVKGMQDICHNWM